MWIPRGCAEHGFKTGDVILEVAGRKVGSAVDVRNAVQAAGMTEEQNPEREIVGSALLPDRRRQDRGVPRACRVRDRLAAAPASRSTGRGSVRDHALHAAAADARPAVARCRETVDPSRREFTAAARDAFPIDPSRQRRPGREQTAMLHFQYLLPWLWWRHMNTQIRASDSIGELGLPWRIGGSRDSSWP